MRWINNNGLETSNKLNKITCKVGNQQASQMLIPIREKGGKLSNMPSLCLPIRTEDLHYLMHQDIKTTFPT